MWLVWEAVLNGIVEDWWKSKAPGAGLNPLLSAKCWDGYALDAVMAVAVCTPDPWLGTLTMLGVLPAPSHPAWVHAGS